MTVSRLAAVVLVLLGPLVFASEVQAALDRVLSYGVPALLLLAARTGATVLGFVAGRRLWERDEAAWRLVRLWALASSIVLVWTFLTPYFPSNRTPAGKQLWLAGWLAVYAAWLALATFRVRRGVPGLGDSPGDSAQ